MSCDDGLMNAFFIGAFASCVTILPLLLVLFTGGFDIKVVEKDLWW